MSAKKAKVVLVGDIRCGKTNLMYAYFGDEFKNEVANPVPEARSRDVEVLDEQINVGVSDTRGSFEFDKLRPLAYPHTTCFIICFSVTSPKSFDSIKTKWITELATYCPHTPFIIVGTKSDLRADENILHKLEKNNQQPVTKQQAEELAAEYKTSYWECSALNRDGVEHPFNAAIAKSIDTLLYSAENGWQAAPPRSSGGCFLL